MGAGEGLQKRTTRLAPFHAGRLRIRYGSTLSRECPTLRLDLLCDQRISQSCQQPRPQQTAPFSSVVAGP